MNCTTGKVYFRPKISQKLEFTIRETKRIDQYIGQQRNPHIVEIASSLRLLYAWDSLTADSNYIASLNVLNFDQGIVNRREGNMSDGTNVKDSPLQKSLAAFKDASFSLRVARSGEILQIDGYDKFRTKFERMYGENSDGDTVNIDAFFPNKYFHELFGRINANIPVSGVSEGAEWQFQQSTITFDPMTSVVSYKLVSFDDNVANIHATYQVNYHLPIKSDTAIQIVGKGEGEIKLNSETGIVISATNSISATGNVNLGSSILTTKIEFSTQIESKVIN